MNKLPENSLPVCLDIPDEFRAEARYVFSTLFRMAGLSYREEEVERAVSREIPLLVYYGMNPDRPLSARASLRIQAASYYGEGGSVAPATLEWMQRTSEGAQISGLPERSYFLYRGKLFDAGQVWYREKDSHQPLMVYHDNQIFLATDLVASAFYLLSLEGERQSRERDTYGRFRPEFSPLGREVYRFPAVDAYVALLVSSLRFLAEKVGIRLQERPRWPQNAPFAVALSHDVDRLQSWTFAKIKRAIRKGNSASSLPKRFIQTVLSAAQKTNWSGNFEFILELEKRYGAQSTFFFVARNRMERDPAYSLAGNRLRRGIGAILQAGSAVGLHGSFLSYDSREMLLEEKDILERHIRKPVAGIRQHYLRFDSEKTWEHQQAAGFRYDTTLGFDNMPGYRAGTSLPFHPFHWAQKQPLPLLEIPLILMDTVLWLENNLYLDARQARKVVEQFLTRAKNMGGLLVLNWHNNNIHPRDVTGFTDLYDFILRWVTEHHGWLTSPDKIWEWWESGYVQND